MKMLLKTIIMKCSLLLVLLPVVLGETAAPEPNDGCSVIKVEECISALPMLDRAIAPLYDDSELDAICSAWSTGQTCVSDVDTACTPSDEDIEEEGKEMGEEKKEEDHPVQRTEQQIYAIKTATQKAREYLGGYNFLCDADNKQTYREHVRMCLDEYNQNLTRDATDCYDAYYSVTWYLNTNDPINQYEFCNAAKDYLDCLKTAATSSCGETEAAWVWDYQLAIWTPHLDDIECSTKGGMSSGALAVILFCAAGAVWAIAMSLFSFCFKPEKKIIKKRESEIALKKSASSKELEMKRVDSKANGMNGDPGQINPVFTQLPEHGILKHRHNASSPDMEITKMPTLHE